MIVDVQYTQLCLVCSLSAEGVMRTMTPDKLLKAMPALQTQVDTLLEFDVSLTLALCVRQLNVGVFVCLYCKFSFVSLTLTIRILQVFIVKL